MKKRKINTIPTETKIEIVSRYENGEKAVDLAVEYNVGKSSILRWVNEYNIMKDEIRDTKVIKVKEKNKIAELERKVGELTMENDFLKKTLNRMKETVKLKKELGEI